MSTYKVKSNLKHDGKKYKKGDEVELNEEQAKQLLKDGVVVDPKAKEDEEGKRKNPQPPVNNVKREGDNVKGKQKVEPGAENQSTEDDKENADEKSKFTVLQNLEFPKGTTQDVGAVIELTQVEADGFAEGLIELVDDNL